MDYIISKWIHINNLLKSKTLMWVQQDHCTMSSHKCFLEQKQRAATLLNTSQNINHNIWIISLISGHLRTATHVLVVQPLIKCLEGRHEWWLCCTRPKNASSVVSGKMDCTSCMCWGGGSGAWWYVSVCPFLTQSALFVQTYFIFCCCLVSSCTHWHSSRAISNCLKIKWASCPLSVHHMLTFHLRSSVTFLDGAATLSWRHTGIWFHWKRGYSSCWSVP